MCVVGWDPRGHLLDRKPVGVKFDAAGFFVHTSVAALTDGGAVAGCLAATAALEGDGELGLKSVAFGALGFGWWCWRERFLLQKTVFWTLRRDFLLLKELTAVRVRFGHCLVCWIEIE